MLSSDTSLIIEKILSLSRLMKENMSYETDLLHLTLLQMQALIFLHKHENAQMREVAQHFNIEMPTATNLIAKLVKQHLVVRQPDQTDKRLVRIVLTTKGQTLLTDAIEKRNKKMSLLLGKLTTHEKEQLLAILSTMLATMGETNEK